MSRRNRKGRLNGKAKSQSKLKQQLILLEQLNADQAHAVREGPIKKRWTTHDIKSVKALTNNQQLMFDEWRKDHNICAGGSAGTGKTFLALYLAFQEVLSKETPLDKVIIVRSNVSTRDMGFLPGTTEEKMMAYEVPYHDICEELFGRTSTYNNMKDAKLIQFIPTSFIRGRTWNDAVIIVEEISNMNFHEIDSVMTRVGQNSRVICTGDIPQADLPHVGKDKSGMEKMLQVIKDMEDFKTIKFTHDDIVRGPFVKQWIIASEDIAA